MSRHLKSTRADQFNAKVHGLKEIFNRLDRRTYPLPTGNDVANYLKWFQQTLQSLVKETRPELTKDRCTFNRQMYPSMDYTGLYKALGKIVNVVPVVEIGVEGTRLGHDPRICDFLQDLEKLSSVETHLMCNVIESIPKVKGQTTETMNNT